MTARDDLTRWTRDTATREALARLPGRPDAAPALLVLLPGAAVPRAVQGYPWRTANGLRVTFVREGVARRLGAELGPAGAVATLHTAPPAGHVWCAGITAAGEMVTRAVPYVWTTAPSTSKPAKPSAPSKPARRPPRSAPETDETAPSNPREPREVSRAPAVASPPDSYIAGPTGRAGVSLRPAPLYVSPPSTRAAATALYQRAARWTPAGFLGDWRFTRGTTFAPECHLAMEEMLRRRGWKPAPSAGGGSRWRIDGAAPPIGARDGVPFLAAVVATLGALAGRVSVPGVEALPSSRDARAGRAFP